jgi:RNA polymerase primary sigma factor
VSSRGIHRNGEGAPPPRWHTCVVPIARSTCNWSCRRGSHRSGNLGLLKAAQRFDETRGYKFIIYAVWWIRQSILAALANHSKIVRMPLNRARVLNQIK